MLADFDGHLILIFDTDLKGIRLKTQGDEKALNQCLEQIIGDRVYTRPTTRRRWTSHVLPFSNHKMKESRRRAHAGNGGELLTIFNPDDRYEAWVPV